MANTLRNISFIAHSVARIAGERMLPVLILLGFGLMLGACTKCDVPTPWQHSSSGSAPVACHDTPQPQ